MRRQSGPSMSGSGKRRMRSRRIRQHSLAISLGWVLASGPAQADRPGPRLPAVCDEDEVRRCAQPLFAGEVAPFDGQLLTPPKALQLAQLAAHCDDRIALEVTRTSSLAAIERAYERELAQAGATALTRERDLYKRLYEAQPSGAPWYAEPAVVAAIAVLGTLGVVLLATRVVELGGR